MLPPQQELGGPLGLSNAQTFAIQAQSLKSISAGVLMLLCSEPTRHGLLPNTSGNEVLQPGLEAEGNRGTVRPVVHQRWPTWER